MIIKFTQFNENKDMDQNKDLVISETIRLIKTNQEISCSDTDAKSKLSKLYDIGVIEVLSSRNL